MASCRLTAHSTRGSGYSFSTGKRTDDGPAPLFTLTFVIFSPRSTKSIGCLFAVLICGSFDVSFGSIGIEAIFT